LAACARTVAALKFPVIIASSAGEAIRIWRASAKQGSEGSPIPDSSSPRIASAKGESFRSCH
jgi:hypothetical protein